MNARTQREDLEQLAREIAETEQLGISLARLLAARQRDYLLGYAIDWDAAAAQQREVSSPSVRRATGEQREVNNVDHVNIIGAQHVG